MLNGGRDFWNQLIEKTFMALIAWFLISLIQDVRTLNLSIQELNQKMAVVVTQVANQQEQLQDLKTDVRDLQKNIKHQ